MNYEKNILASIFQNKPAYMLVEGRLAPDDITEHGAIILDAVATFYSKDKAAESCDKELITNAICRKLASPKHREMFTGLVGEIATMKVSPANVMADYFAMKREDAGTKLASALLGHKGADIPALIEDYTRWLEPEDAEDTSEDIIVGLSVEDLVRDRLNEKNLIRLLPKALNDRVDGGLLPGNHLVLFARPEMGKTMVTINMMAGFARQNLRTIYVGNEDPLPDIIMRTICRLSLRPKAEVLANTKAADAAARACGYENIIFAGLAPGTPREIEKLIKQYQPQVVVVDQLRNISMKEDNTVVRLEKAASAMRTLGKRYNCAMISVTQAGDSASGKAVLDMGDVDFSNTGIPATADVMVGLGGTDDDVASERRVMSLPKNKRGGVHGFFPVSVDRTRSMVVSLV